MKILSSFDRSRAAWHLGYNAGAQIPAGDYARFIEATNKIPDSYWYERIINQLNRCDRAYDVSDVLGASTGATGLQPTRSEVIAGDVNRTMIVSEPDKANAKWWEIYLTECDRLAEALYIANYRRELVRRYAFERSGSEFINALPGPADVAVGTRIFLSEDWR
ncbi:hypothetical protein VZG28_05120 [Synechococcus elongatus IITB4]|uniref:hypothetical protein n=1 Tax=Synechococcus elongatus TaxID=32046 RepID=UPI0030CA9307